VNRREHKDVSARPQRISWQFRMAQGGLVVLMALHHRRLWPPTLPRLCGTLWYVERLFRIAEEATPVRWLRHHFLRGCHRRGAWCRTWTSACWSWSV